MFNFSPASKTILIAIAGLAMVLLLARLFFKWRARRVGSPGARRKAAPPIAGSIAPTAVPLSSPFPKDAPELPSRAPVTVPFAAKSPTSDSVPMASVARTSYTTASSAAKRLEGEPVSLEFEDFPDSDESDYKYGSLTPTLAAMLPESDERRRKSMRMLQNAGEYGRHAWHNFAAARYLGLIIPIFIFGVGLLFVPEQLEGLMIVGLVVGPLLGWAVPTIMLQGRAQARLKEIAQGVPDMLDILNMCVSQGMTVPSALGRVGHDLAPVYPALSKELKIVTEQSRVGTLNQALAGFSRRCDIPEVHSFTSLLMQTEKMGTSMSAALSEYSDNMRESVKQRADEKSNSATFKLLFPTVLCLMPAVFLLLLGPAIVELSNFFNRGGSDILRSGGRGVQDVRQN